MIQTVDFDETGEECFVTAKGNPFVISQLGIEPSSPSMYAGSETQSSNEIRSRIEKVDDSFYGKIIQRLRADDVRHRSLAFSSRGRRASVLSVFSMADSTKSASSPDLLDSSMKFISKGVKSLFRHSSIRSSLLVKTFKLPPREITQASPPLSPKIASRHSRTRSDLSMLSFTTANEDFCPPIGQTSRQRTPSISLSHSQANGSIIPASPATEEIDDDNLSDDGTLRSFGYRPRSPNSAFGSLPRPQSPKKPLATVKDREAIGRALLYKGLLMLQNQMTLREVLGKPPALNRESKRMESDTLDTFLNHHQADIKILEYFLITKTQSMANRRDSFTMKRRMSVDSVTSGASNLIVGIHKPFELETATRIIGIAALPEYDLPIAQFCYGMLLRSGIGCRQNIPLALETLFRAAANDEPMAMYQIALNSTDQRDEYLKWMKNAAAHKSHPQADACFKVGEFYLGDEGKKTNEISREPRYKKKDKIKSAFYFRRAAERGMVLPVHYARWVWKTKYNTSRDIRHSLKSIG